MCESPETKLPTSIFAGFFSSWSWYRRFTIEPTSIISPTNSCPVTRILFFSRERIVYEVFKSLSIPQPAVGTADTGVPHLHDDGERVVRIFFLIEERHRDLTQNKPATFFPAVFLEVERQSLDAVLHTV